MRVATARCKHTAASRVAHLYVDDRPLFKCDDCGAQFVYKDGLAEMHVPVLPEETP